MMPLRQLVERYLSHAGAFGKPVPLAAFALSPAETERLFAAYDEDYHISRFLDFSEAADPQARRFSVNGAAVTHVAVDAEIQSIL